MWRLWLQCCDAASVSKSVQFSCSFNANNCTQNAGGNRKLIVIERMHAMHVEEQSGRDSCGPFAVWTPSRHAINVSHHIRTNLFIIIIVIYFICQRCVCVRFVFVFMIIFIFIYRKMQIADERTFFCAGKKKENLCVLNRVRIEKPERRFLSYCFSYTFSCGGCGGRIYGGLSSFQWGSVCVRMCVSNISCNNNTLYINGLRRSILMRSSFPLTIFF